MNAIAAALIGTGLIFCALSVLGVLRFPDCYTRAHALGLGDSLGALGVLAGLMVWLGLKLLTLKVLILALIFVVINPTLVHIILKAAWRAGLTPWQRP